MCGGVQLCLVCGHTLRAQSIGNCNCGNVDLNVVCGMQILQTVVHSNYSPKASKCSEVMENVALGAEATSRLFVSFSPPASPYWFSWFMGSELCLGSYVTSLSLCNSKLQGSYIAFWSQSSANFTNYHELGLKL